MTGGVGWPDRAPNGPLMTQFVVVQLCKKLRVAVQLEYSNGWVTLNVLSVPSSRVELFKRFWAESAFGL
jgi:hypothetical protein